MMTNILISALIAALRGKLGADLLMFLQAAIKTLADSSIPGPEKKTLVLDQASTFGGSVAEQFISASGWALNLVIELLVAKYKLQSVK